MPSNFKVLLVFCLGLFLGENARKWLFVNILGYNVSPEASIGNCLVRVANVRLGKGCRIGHFTMIRNLETLEMATNARIGTFNWIFGMIDAENQHFQIESKRESALILGEDSSLTSRHIIDCTDTVKVGSFSTVAGFRSQILTHGIDVSKNRQSCSKVTIGNYCMIGTGCILLKGSIVPEGTLLSAGSVFRGSPKLTHQIYSGNPAEPVKPLDPNKAYFLRSVGSVE